MKFRTLRVIVLMCGFLIVVEAGLEVRSFRRGWRTILFGAPESVVVVTEEDGEVTFGPRPGFPFRSELVPVRKPEATTRVWIASSSYGEDTRLGPAEIFPHLLGERLNREGWQVEILNASRAGWTIRANVSDLRSLAAHWQPDIVMLYQMSLEINELSNWFLASTRSPEQVRPGEGDVDDADNQTGSWVAKLAERTTAYRLLKTNVTARLSASRILRNGLGREAEREFEDRVVHFVEETLALGARPVLCTFATSHDRRHLGAIPGDIKASVFRWNMYLSMEGWITTVERFNDMIRRIAADRDLVLADVGVRLGGRPEYFRDFVHFTPEGHRLVADVIADALLAAAPEVEVL